MSAIGVVGLALNLRAYDFVSQELRAAEDPEFEFAPCNRLAQIGDAMHTADASAAQAAVPRYTDRRDITSFARRSGRLPAQKEGDELDYRGLLNRDGSVLLSVSSAQLDEPQALYKSLGCKTVVGLPFKDIATADAYVLREVPPESSTIARQTSKRMQDVAIHPIVPASSLAQTPLPGAIPLMTLPEAVAAPPQPRLVVSLTGKETEEEVAALKNIQHDFVLLEVDPSLSRLHASRRLFGILTAHGIDSAVIHHYRPGPSDMAELALQMGTQVGGLLCDGLGDGVLITPQAGADFGTNFLQIGRAHV